MYLRSKSQLATNHSCRKRTTDRRLVPAISSSTYEVGDGFERAEVALACAAEGIHDQASRSHSIGRPRMNTSRAEVSIPFSASTCFMISTATRPENFLHTSQSYGGHTRALIS